jgi:hypothetical protein
MAAAVAEIGDLPRDVPILFSFFFVITVKIDFPAFKATSGPSKARESNRRR